MRLFLLLFALLCASCQPHIARIEPELLHELPLAQIDGQPSPFPTLSRREVGTEWGREMHLAELFLRDEDLYQAVTCCKRAAFLIPRENEERRWEAHYRIVFCLYLGNRFQEAVEAFERSDLLEVGPRFPAWRDLLILLYDAYQRCDRSLPAEAVLQALETVCPQTASNLRLSQALQEAGWEEIEEELDRRRAAGEEDEEVRAWKASYERQAKSVRTAQWLNALLPGAGYAYVGLYRTANTSFLLNALFLAASWECFSRGEWAAGAIALGFESGWYFGGINGAGLAAKRYNERLYEEGTRVCRSHERLFPLLQLEYGF